MSFIQRADTLVNFLLLMVHACRLQLKSFFRESNWLSVWSKEYNRKEQCV